MKYLRMSTRFFLFILTNLYIYSLVYIYINFAYPKYSYLGWQINTDVNFLFVFIIALLTSLFVFFIKRRIEGPLEILVLISYLIIYLPSLNLALVCISNNSHLFELFFSYTVSIFLLIFLSKVKVNDFYFKCLLKKHFNILFYTALAFMFSLVFLIYKPDFSNITRMLDFSDVYELREGYRETNKNVPTIINYFFTWIIKVFIPFVFVIGVINKSIKLKIMSLFMVFSMFLVSGHKSIVLGFGLVLLLNWVFKSKEPNTFTLAKGLISLAITSTILAILKFPILQDVIVRRAILVPGLLSNLYFDYFTKNDFTLMGYSIFSFIVNYSYDKTPPYIIGEYYFNRAEMSANANYMAAAYADFGVLGTIIITLLCGIYFKLINIIVARKNMIKLSCLLSIVPMWALLDSSFLTVLVTHGLIWLIVLLLLIPKGYINDKNN